jgi:hypothetical protein
MRHDKAPVKANVQQARNLLGIACKSWRSRFDERTEMNISTHEVRRLSEVAS